ncbi:MAG: hypothetical protein MZU95_06010 [Desulfomicrobium escambiense]|nr:hypothetical protein [Desulfomicrobium escambiense]
MKATEVVRILGELRGIEYKKGTTNLKLSAEEAGRIREAIGRAPVAPERVEPVLPSVPLSPRPVNLRRRDRWKSPLPCP